jgi:hypothetical protein
MTTITKRPTRKQVERATRVLEAALQFESAIATQVGSDVACILDLKLASKEHGGCYQTATAGRKTACGLARLLLDHAGSVIREFYQ